MPAPRLSPALASLVAIAGLAAAPEALAAGDAARGRALLEQRGCVACHSLDGTPRQGPTFAGLAGKQRRVLTGGALREVVADAAYLRRSMLEPNHDVVEGYALGSMAALPLREGEADDLVAAIEALGAKEPAPAQGGGLGSLIGAVAAFVGGHLALSSGPVRRRLIAGLGEKAFQGVYSLIALASFIWLVMAFRSAPYVALWSSPGWTRHIPLALMPISYVLMVAGFSTKNPTAAGQGLAADAEPYGIVRVTRHPALWGFALWALAHVPPNGDARSMLLFGGIAVLSLAGMVHIDRRRRAALGEGWERFAAKTSLVPFAAILAGRGRLSLREIGVARPVIGLVLYAAMLHLHRMIIGVSAMP